MPPSTRSRVRRLPERAHYDRETVHAILREAPICHVAFVADGQPFVIPTLHGLLDDRLVLHGSRASRLMTHAGGGFPLCVAATLVDGVVLARSAFHHSMNYRSAVLFGTGRLITDRAEKLASLAAISDHVAPGRWADARLPSEKELGATSVIRMDIEEATAKIRTGGPNDDEKDYELPVWAGVLPLRTVAGPLEPDPKRVRDVPVPAYLADLVTRP